jgi:hypothetical protein
LYVVVSNWFGMDWFGLVCGLVWFVGTLVYPGWLAGWLVGWLAGVVWLGSFWREKIFKRFDGRLPF